MDNYVKGHFVGHLIPGVLFLLWGHAWLLHFLAHRPPPAPGGGARVAATWPGFTTRSYYFSIELWVRLLGTLAGILGELRAGVWAAPYFKARRAGGCERA